MNLGYALTFINRASDFCIVALIMHGVKGPSPVLVS